MLFLFSEIETSYTHALHAPRYRHDIGTCSTDRRNGIVKPTHPV
jgi:hypothetical protein